MKMLSHPNIVTLYNSFYSETENVELFVLDLVLGWRILASRYGIHS